MKKKIEAYSKRTHKSGEDTKSGEERKGKLSLFISSHLYRSAGPSDQPGNKKMD